MPGDRSAGNRAMRAAMALTTAAQVGPLTTLDAGLQVLRDSEARCAARSDEYGTHGFKTGQHGHVFFRWRWLGPGGRRHRRSG